MNLKNRLTRIEGKLNINSNLCNCPREVLFKVIPFGEPIPEEPEVFCETCHKLIPSRAPITFNIGNAEINVLTPATNFTREEFEAWQNEHVVSGHITYEQHLAEQRSRG